MNNNETPDHTQTSIADRYFCISCHSTHSPAERIEKFRSAVREVFPFIEYVAPYEREEFHRVQQELKQSLQKKHLEWQNRPRSVKIWEWLTDPKISLFAMMVGMFVSHLFVQLVTLSLK